MKANGKFPKFEAWQEARLTGRAGIRRIYLFDQRKGYDHQLYQKSKGASQKRNIL